MAKVKRGTEQAHGIGYDGSGFKFNEEEDEARRSAKKAQAREYGYEEDKSDSDSDEEGGVRKAGGDLAAQAIAAAQAAAALAAAKAASNANQQITSTNAGSLLSIPVVANAPNNEATACALQAALNIQQNLARIQAHVVPEHYEAELEINDFAQNARWKITHKETLGPIQDWTGVAITTRGTFIPQGKIVSGNERKLYLFIEGPTELSVKKAKSELKRVLEDCANHALNLPGSAQTGKTANSKMQGFLVKVFPGRWTAILVFLDDGVICNICAEKLDKWRFSMPLLLSKNLTVEMCWTLTLSSPCIRSMNSSCMFTNIKFCSDKSSSMP
uniref:ATP-dependent RNA helicase PRP5/DDX46/KHDC4 KH domain-containing protein n=1 Tax=Oryza punctata TaxID=4537 RepID=A0A0E0LRB4_ORYPU